MTDEKLNEVLLLFQNGTQAIILSDNIGADWFRINWIIFTIYPFELGIRFPSSKLIEDTLTALHVSPRQLMPSAWRVLACLDAVESKHDLGIGVDVVKCCYSIKKFNGYRYGLSSKKKDDPLIHNLDVMNDRGWKVGFFFVDKDTLSGHTNYLISLEY
ncbi:hypothetical protein OROGR_030726 [Orobanche gracilis]